MCWFIATRKNAAEKKLIIMPTKKLFPKNAQYQKTAQSIKNMLEGYQKNRIELAINGFSNIFAFV